MLLLTRDMMIAGVEKAIDEGLAEPCRESAKRKGE